MLIQTLMIALLSGAPPTDLTALLDEAQRNNPEIAAALSRQAAAEALPSQREAPPDPIASVAYTNDTVTGLTLGSSEVSTLAFGWTQEVPYPGKLRLAGDAARREAEVSRRRVEIIRLDLTSRIKQGYANLYRLDRTMSILADSRQLLLSLQDSTRARYEGGAGILHDVLKAQTEVTRLDVELAKLAQERSSQQAELNVLAGRTPDRLLGPAVTLPSGASIDPVSLEQEALSNSPEILELESAVTRDDAELQLARRQLKPDFMWGAAYQNRGGLDPMVMGMFGLRLPVYRDRKQAQGIVQAEHGIDASKQDVAAARLRIASTVRDLSARVARAESLEQLYTEAVIPQAQSAFESSSSAYSVGRVDFLALLNDFTTLLGYEVDLETQRAEKVSALAGLERLTARQLLLAETTSWKVTR